MQILQTKNYDDFKIITSNREVDKNHVKRLSKSILRKNLLYIRPVICNQDMEVIDGQHRIAACQLIDEPVFYIKVDSLTKEDIGILNTAQKNLTITQEDRAHQVCDWIMDLKARGFEFVLERDFGKAFSVIVKTADQFKELLRQATAESFYKCTSAREYRAMIKSILP
jgi:hypothetical protein